MEQKLILGISSSPRKGANTDTALRIALEEAEKNPWIKTKTIYLRDYEIHPCIGCVACCNEPCSGTDCACKAYNDGMQEIYPLLKECDALILATPVYFGSANAQMKMFMDRTEGLLRYGSSSYQYALRDKIGAGIAVGGNRNGGQEFTLQAIHYYMMIHDMIVVGSGEEPTPGCYIGGCVTNSPDRGKVRDSITRDELGQKSCRMVGKNVAHALSLLK